MNIRITKLSDIVPDLQHAKAGDAGFDLYSREQVVLAPGMRTVVPTGIAIEIPEGYVGLIWDKSGLAIKYGLKTLGGVIDSGYRGEVMVGIINLSNTEYIFEPGHKIAQMVIQKFETVTFEQVDELSETERAHTGFGSSGK
jgi:dUTP pyrophosphatase